MLSWLTVSRPVPLSKQCTFFNCFVLYLDPAHEVMSANAGDFVVLHQLGWELDQKTPVIGSPAPSQSAHHEPAEEGTVATYCLADNRRSMKTGHLPMGSLYILPSINSPKPEFIDAFSSLVASSESKQWLNMVDDINSQRSRPSTTHFQRRPSSHNEMFFRQSGFSAVEDLSSNYSQRPASQNSDVDCTNKSAYVVSTYLSISSI